MASAVDPYSPPSPPVDAGLQITPGRFYRDNEFLRLCAGAELPLICPVTGEAVAWDGWRKTQTMAWLSPRLVAMVVACISIVGIAVNLRPSLMPLATIIPLMSLAIVAFLLRRGSFTCSLASSISRKFAIRRTISIVLLIAGIDLFIGMIALKFSNAAMAMGSVSALAFIASVIFAVLAKPLRTAGYYRGWFKIKGCSPLFLEALPSFPLSAAEKAQGSWLTRLRQRRL